MHTPSSILIDVELPDPSPLPPALVKLVSSLRVVIVGWYEVPEQTSPEQAREQFEDEAGDALQEIATPFEEAGADVTQRLVFTGNVFDTVSRISVEENCDAVYIARPAKQLQNVLVPLRGTHNIEEIMAFVADLLKERETKVTMLHVIEKGESEEKVLSQIIEPARARITDQGIDDAMLSDRLIASDDPADVIIEEAEKYDLVVLGETEPTIRDILFGTVPERIATNSNVPVMVVRHLADEEPAAEATS
ncbi:universal stress protein [Longibacter salinarum]|uniref:Universal stress protein n=1 Tax=Longibacter salinarum TaxID=1850348 RepID=A0A2A8CUF1_9BACT|nr:universal stress protein [Longibacter salinarum]PEN12236.1 universal stress protein [Longibacter salinarum]